MPTDANQTLIDGIPLEPSGGGQRRPSLVELSGGDLGRQILLEEDRTVIGRGGEATVRLRDARASREHAAIIVSLDDVTGKEVFRIHDLDSSNGTFVNGQRITDAPLHDGDKVQIGHTVFKFAMKDMVELDFENKIYQLATTDPLTNLYTRDFLFKEFGRLARHSQRYERPFTVLMIDLDDFKGVNDTHGHIAGDRVLESTAKLLVECFRNEDILGRYGGEEFIALLPETDSAGAKFPAQRFLDMLARRAVAVPDGPELTVTASIGIAGFPEHGQTQEILLAAADAALYVAKEKGKNQAVLAAARVPHTTTPPAAAAAAAAADPPESDGPGDDDPFAD